MPKQSFVVADGDLEVMIRVTRGNKRLENKHYLSEDDILHSSVKLNDMIADLLRKTTEEVINKINK